MFEQIKHLKHVPTHVKSLNQSEGWERIIALPRHTNCQGSVPGVWILGGGSGGGNSMGHWPKPMETVQDLAFTTVMVRSGLGNIQEVLFACRGCIFIPTVRKVADVLGDQNYNCNL